MSKICTIFILKILKDYTIYIFKNKRQNRYGKSRRYCNWY